MVLPYPMIQRKIYGIGSELNEYYELNLVIIGNCSFSFASDLYRLIQDKVESVSILEPYFDQENEKIVFGGSITTDLTNKECFVIHAVSDTGLVHHSVMEYISEMFPNCRIRNICMIDKLHNRKFEYHTDYSVLEVKDQDIFFVGYGISLNKEYKDLKGIYQITEVHAQQE